MKIKAIKGKSKFVLKITEYELSKTGIQKDELVKMVNIICTNLSKGGISDGTQEERRDNNEV